jgi:hypothetical protein
MNSQYFKGFHVEFGPLEELGPVEELDAVEELGPVEKMVNKILLKKSFELMGVQIILLYTIQS